MRRRKGLLFVIALLALSGVMAAMSFSSVTVEAKAKVRVVDTTNGLLALIPGDGGAAKVENGNLLVDLTGGSGQYGLQPGSTYSWDNLFKVKNNSSHPVTVKVNGLGDLSKFGQVTATVVHGGSKSLLSDGVKLMPGETGEVNLTVHVNDNAPKGNGSSVVHISAVAAS